MSTLRSSLICVLSDVVFLDSSEELKLPKVAAMLQIPKPLLVTRAYCSEVTIKVPSWTQAEKFVQEPLSFKVVDLFIDVKNAYDCDDEYRKAAEARVQAASMEPDPLGSIASWYAFSTILNERVELVVDNIYVKVFAKGGVSRIRVELANFHSRTTNALWQDMRDLTTCVDRSPDGLLKTRFKFVSFCCSILLQAENPNAQSASPPLTILHDHAVAMRMTLFGHRRSKVESWETLSHVIDVNLHTLPFEYEVAQLVQIYEMCTTVYGWIHDAKAQERAAALSGAGLSGTSPLLLHHHQVQRGAVMNRTKKSGDGEGDEEDVDSEASFALQLTFRFTVDATLRFASERLGKQQIRFTAQHAAINLILHHDNVRELQVTVHEVAVKFHDEIVLYLKPDRDVLQLKQFNESVFLKWHLQTLTCRIENDLALILNEAYHAQNEKEQSVFIKCGTCMQQIRLESIETHVCGDSARSPAFSTASAGSRSRGSSAAPPPQSRNGSNADQDQSGGGRANKDRILDSTAMPKLRAIFALDELELTIDSHLFHTIQQLLRSTKMANEGLAERTFRVEMRELNITTESKEFVGDAIFVPVLPLAFQMLECTIQGCGCIRKTRDKANLDERTNSRTSSSGLHSATVPSIGLPRWPDRVFVELRHLACKATSPKPLLSTESFLVAEAISVRSSFSDGGRICANCHPQMSVHASVDRIRCQFDHRVLQSLYKAFGNLRDPFDGECIISQTLFLAVMEIRAIELTLLDANAAASSSSRKSAKMKSLFKQVSLVADNQLGHLSLQSSLDFRSLFNSQMIRFFHRQATTDGDEKVDAKTMDPVVESEDAKQEETQTLLPSLPRKPFTKQQLRRLRQASEQQNAVQAIQRTYRRFRTQQRSRSHPHATAQSCERSRSSKPSLDSDHAASDGDDAIQMDQFDSSGRDKSMAKSEHAAISSSSPPPAGQKRKCSTSGAASLFSSVPEELMSPKKMVAAASVLTNFVKSKHQQLESEVVGLATHSKESAARLVMPRYTACKKLFGLDASGNETQDGRRESTKDLEVRSVSESSSSRSLTMEPTESIDPGGNTLAEELEENHGELPDEEEDDQQEEVNGIAADSRSNSFADGDEASESRCGKGAQEAQDQGEEDQEEEEDTVVPPATEDIHEATYGLSDELLAKLPDVLRVLVQVEEHRMRVPINPREKVGFLCREIVRRFNEVFAHNGYISHVTLQDARGGVFAPTDIVGFVYASEDEILFALPRQADAKTRSVAHIEPSASCCSDGARASATTSSKIAGRSKKATRAGARFSRCSQLPLPLAIALLANESERDLLHCVMREGSFGSAGGGKVDEWPELALNGSFLDPNHVLQVEVRWVGTCLEVTNVDAFVLCLQQLGLCTSRASSKYVGKLLRDRLRMDETNPLVHSACMRSPEFRPQGQHCGEGGGEEEREVDGEMDVPISYASLKAIVQEDFGVYTQRA